MGNPTRITEIKGKNTELYTTASMTQPRRPFAHSKLNFKGALCGLNVLKINKKGIKIY